MLKPLNNRVVVKPIARSETTSGGLVVPAGQKRPPNRGVVVAGNDEVSPGQIVMFVRYGGTPHEEELILEDSEILAILGHVEPNH